MVGTRVSGAESVIGTPPIAAPAPRITYVAYPSSLVLRSANAVQTYATVDALRACVPEFEALIPRFAWRTSHFVQLGATHLVRLPFNAGRHLVRSVLWSYLERTWFAWRVLMRLVMTAPTRRPEVVYVRDAICAYWLALMAPKVLRLPVIFEMHDREATNPSANSGPVARWLAPRLDRGAVRHATGLVSLTETFIPELKALTGAVGFPPVRVIPDAYDERLYLPQERDEARRIVDLPPDAWVIAYTGLTFAYHGVDLLVKAFARVADELPSALLLLVGGRDGERAAIAEQAERLRVAGRVRIVPPQPAREMPTHLAAADLLVIPDTVTKASASPLKLFEYAAMERPIVAPDLPALHEILPPDAAGYVTPGDPAALAGGIQWMAEHPADAAAMAARARAAVEMYTYRNRAAAIVAFCQDLIGRPDA